MKNISKKKLARILGRKPFLNPYYDSSESDPTLWTEEVEIVQRIMAGERLVSERFCLEERKGYGVLWYWETHPHYPAAETEYDGPVMRLMSRGVIRQVQCAGGADRMILTEAAEKAIAAASKTKAVPA